MPHVRSANRTSLITGDGIRGGWLRVVGGKEYKLDHAPEAHRALEMRATQGKVYLTP